MWRKGLTGAALLACEVIVAGSAGADDQPFVHAYTTDIQTQHGLEFEQWLGLASGHSGEAFTGFQSRSELEYGFTDDLQGSLYLNYEWERIRPHPLPAPTETASLASVSGEAIWRVMNPYFDPFGLAFYFEPTIGSGLREFEVKILAQKNFFNDRLRNVINVNFESVREKSGGVWEKSSAIEFNFASAYNVTPDFSIGVEFDNERGYDRLLLGSATPSSNSFFLGPTLQLIGHPWTVTAGVQAQMPWASNPSHTPGAVVGGRTADAEQLRATIKLSRDI
jgi:hypothetical protein